MAVGVAECELCAGTGGVLLWESPDCRVVRVDDPHYPGFCRVIWQDHVREMTDLPAEARGRFMAVVFAVERAVRDVCAPDKINLASLGNVTPHLHWHVIPRWRDDLHFPQPIWGEPLRPGSRTGPGDADDRLRQALALALGPCHEGC